MDLITLERNRNKMDYLEEAMKDVQGCLGMDTYEGEQARATVSIANALIALVKRLDATAQDVAARVELASPEKLADLERSNITGVDVDNELYDLLGQAQDRLDALERDESQVEKRVSGLELASEIAGLEFPDKLAKIVLTNTNLLKVLNERLVEIDREIETVKRQQTALLDVSGRIDEIEKTLSGVATWCGSIEMRIEIIEGVNGGKESE